MPKSYLCLGDDPVAGMETTIPLPIASSRNPILWATGSRPGPKRQENGPDGSEYSNKSPGGHLVHSVTGK